MSRRARRIPIVALFAFAGAAAGQTILGPPRLPVPIPKRPTPGEAPRGAILVGAAGKDLVAISCLGGQAADRGYWTPSNADVRRLEAVLPAFMSAQQTPSDFQPLHEYYRQYAGFTIEGKKFVCVNFFHVSHLEGTLSLAQRDPDLFNKLKAAGPPEDYWRREPVIVLDGGAHFFSIQFQPGNAAFHDLRFNGYG